MTRLTPDAVTTESVRYAWLCKLPHINDISQFLDDAILILDFWLLFTCRFFYENNIGAYLYPIGKCWPNDMCNVSFLDDFDLYFTHWISLDLRFTFIFAPTD